MRLTTSIKSTVFPVILLSLLLVVFYSNTTKTVEAEIYVDQQYTLLEPLPQISSASPQATPATQVNLTSYIKDAINLLIAISAAAAVFMIVWGGLQYMTTDSWEGKTEGREKAWNAVIGLLMVLSTYLILRTVNPSLVQVAAIPKICNTTYGVADANGNCPTLNGSSSDSLRQLELQQSRDIDQSSAATAAIKDIRAASQSKVATLEEQANTLQDLIYSLSLVRDDTDPQIQSLQAELGGIENQMSLEKSTAAVAEGKVGFDSSIYVAQPVGQGTSVSKGTDYASILNDIDARYDRLSKDVTDPDQQQLLKNYMYYTKATVLIDQAVSKVDDVVNSNAAAGTVKNFFSSIGSGVSGGRLDSWQQTLDKAKADSLQNINDCKANFDATLIKDPVLLAKVTALINSSKEKIAATKLK